MAEFLLQDKDGPLIIIIKMSRKLIISVIFTFLIIIALTWVNRTFVKWEPTHKANNHTSQQHQPQQQTDSPSPKPFSTYSAPTIEPDNEYTLLLIGDSMTRALGPYPNLLSGQLNNAYPDKGFIIENYSQGSASIEKLPELIRDETLSDETQARPIIDRDYDILVIESMAYNPILAESREQALTQQEQILNQIMQTLINTNPDGLILFLATIAPSKEYYASGVEDLSQDQRARRAEQRRAFIENFIDYAKSHQIPLINVYQKSLQPDGSATRAYIRTDDNIHPSQEGVEFIQRQIAEFIIQNQLLPE